MSRNCLVAVDIRSSHNIGSLFRTCDGFNSDLWLVGICPKPNFQGDNRLPHIVRKIEKDISKTALGAEKTVRWHYAHNLNECIKMLREQGYRIVALEQNTKSKNLYKFVKDDRPVAIFLGREVEGLSELELNSCDEIYEIPMLGKKESFNVSVAAGIALYQISKND